VPLLVPLRGTVFQTRWGNFRLHQVKGAGDCFFHAVAHFVGGTQENVRKRIGAPTRWGGDDATQNDPQVVAQRYQRRVFVFHRDAQGLIDSNMAEGYDEQGREIDMGNLPIPPGSSKDIVLLFDTNNQETRGKRHVDALVSEPEHSP
jgi:hypothetical protein